MVGTQIEGLTREALEELYLNDPDATLASVAKHFGCHREAVRRQLLRLGMQPKSRARRGKPKKGHDKRLMDAVWMRENLAIKTTRKIAAELGCSEGVVAYWAHKLGLLDEDKSKAVKDGLRKRFPNGRTGEDHPRWNGGRRVMAGYIYIYQPDHPRAGTRGVVQEHRLVMEKHLGRYLTAAEIVHHIDGDKQNNKIENLELMVRGQHSHHHFENVTGLRQKIAELEKEIEYLRDKLERQDHDPIE